MSKIIYPINKAQDITLKEDFLTTFHVNQNDGIIGGNPTINHGYEGDGTGDYIDYSNFRWNQNKIFSFFCRIDTIDSFTSKAIFASPDANSPMLRFSSATSIVFWNDTGATSRTFTIPTFVAGDTLGVRYNDSTQKVLIYKNGVASVSGEQTMAQQLNASATTLQMFARLNGLDSFDGRCSSFIWANREYTDEEFLDLHNRATFNYTDRLSALWPLDDKVGDSTFTTTDVSGNGLDLTVDGATKLVGRNGYSFTTNDKLSVSDNTALDATTALSFATWIKLDNLAATQPLAKKGTNYEIDVTTSGFLQFQSETADTTAIPVGQEIFIAVTFDAGTVKYYVNGELSSTVTGATTPLVANSNDFEIGTDGVAFLEGDIVGNYLLDTVNIFTETQIKDLFNKGSI